LALIPAALVVVAPGTSMVVAVYLGMGLLLPFFGPHARTDYRFKLASWMLILP
jgi:hypothetical protein